MLCPNVNRQRISIEFITEANLYTPAMVEKLMDNFLHDLCGSLGMTMLLAPIMKTTDDGISAYAMLLEAIVQIHSWYQHKFVTVDIYSFKSFMVSDVLYCIDFWFEPILIEVL